MEVEVPPFKFVFPSHGILSWNVLCSNLGRFIGHSDCHAVRSETVPIIVIRLVQSPI